MLSIRYVSKFKKDLKKYHYQNSTLAELNAVLKLLLGGRKLPDKYRDHTLIGGYAGMRECHIKPDVLLIYWIDAGNQKLVLARLGHMLSYFEISIDTSWLFKK